MNKNESRYFSTALKMDKALLELLEIKDYAYITVKEICEKAKVNRSTFYLHYETIEDLLSESIEYMYEQFFAYMKHDTDSFIARIQKCPLNELYFITPEYLMPYLNYIKDHKQLFLTALKNAKPLRLEESYDKMFQYIFAPVLERYQVPKERRKYIMAFYIHGLMAIITEWISEDCRETVEYIAEIIQQCVMQNSGFFSGGNLADS